MKLLVVVWNMQVTATNLAAPSASDTTTVVVNIVDINDNKPVFHKRVFEGHQNENTATDTVIVQVYRMFA